MSLIKDGKVYRTIEEQVAWLTKTKFNSYQKEEVDKIAETLNQKINTKQDNLNFDSTPTENSLNPVTSGGVYNAIETEKQEVNQTVEILNQKINTKQDKLTFDNTPTQNSSNPVKSSGIYTYGESIRAVAEGKCKSFTISYANNPSFNSSSTSLSNITSFEDIEGNIIQTSSLKNGDILLVIETDVPDRWWSASDSKFYILETAKVDLSSYATLNDLNYKLDATKCTLQTVEPTNNITDGGIHIVYLTTTPNTFYDGYIYFIKE